MKDSSVYLCAALVATALVWPHQVAHAASAVAKQVNEMFYDGHMKSISKRDAMKSLINSGGVILRCSEVELTDKMTMRKKK